MVLNTGKTKSILLSEKRLGHYLDNSTSDLQINGTKIEQVTSHKLLGVTLDEELNFKEHGENVRAVVHPILAKQTGVSTPESRNMLNVIVQKFSNHVHNCEEFQHIHTLLNYPTNFLDCNYPASLVDLIYSNCKLIDRSNDWSLLLFKEAFHIRRLNPVLNHGARASKELTISPALV